jgi:acyl-CoA synthetase (NDP forming)/GNAT superfamily N-acetyltransferase
VDDADVLLSDGSTVHVRPITPDDADRLVALHARFSDRTRYLRFFAPYPRIPPQDLARFVNVDHLDREALVAVVGDDLIAVGRYERLGSGADDAEVAFVVEDAHQGRGVGSLLLEHLAAAARHNGITRFVAEVLPQNRPMLHVFADAGFQVNRQYEDGVVHLTFPIAPTSRSIEVQRRREQSTEAASAARLMNPRFVAIYGARRDGSGIGATLLRHIIEGGYRGAIYPIHREISTLDGLPAFASAADVPADVDLALVAVPTHEVLWAVEDAGRAGAHALVVVSSGFAEAGDEGAVAQQAVLAAARAHGVRVVGPNCLGILNTDPALRLNATLAPFPPERGRVGIVSQSGAMGMAILAEARQRGVGLSSFASVGNRADVSGNDLLQYWRDDPHTDIVLLYIETFGNPHKFSRIARELGRDKPIVVVWAGAGPNAGLDASALAALFAHSGVIRAQTVAEMFDVAELLANQPLPAGDRVGVVGNAAALVGLASGSCARAGLSVPPSGRIVPTDSEPEVLAQAVAQALADERIDTVLVVVAPPLPSVDVIYETAVAQAVEGADKPVVAAFVGFTVPRTPAWFTTVEDAVRALAHVTRYANWRRQPNGAVPHLSDVDPSLARAVVAKLGPPGELLSAYGVSVLPTRTARTEREALEAAEDVGYPVAVKAAGPELRHRLDLGAVRLDVLDPTSLRAAYREITARYGPSVLVQPMAPPGVACVIEVVDDPAFGPVVGFGLGGIASHLLGDRAWRVAPLTDADAARMVRAPRATAMLEGYRGAPPVDLAAIEDLLVRMGQLADENPEVDRLLLNPVLAHPSGLSIVHADVSYGDSSPRPDTGPRRLITAPSPRPSS